MSKRKTIELPSVKAEDPIPQKLPFNGKAVDDDSFSFSFACFDRNEELFNLGDNNSTGVMPGNWFLDLLDCFKSVNNMTRQEVKQSLHRLHPIDWKNTNADAPVGSEQLEFWQFRVNKSKGRIIGFFIDNVFYVVWLDPHHNLTNSEGYGGIVYYEAPLSEFEILANTNESLLQEIESLKKDCKAAVALADEIQCQYEQSVQVTELGL